jgi:hypothetical protein
VCVAAHCDSITVPKQKDKWDAVSSFHNRELVQKKTSRVDIMKLKHVCDYNEAIGGTNLKDQKVHPDLLERKWFLKLFRRILNAAVHNVYIIYRTRNQKVHHPVYRTDVVETSVPTDHKYHHLQQLANHHSILYPNAFSKESSPKLSLVVIRRQGLKKDG